MLAAMLFALPVTIFPMASLKLGLGMHIWNLKPEWHEPYWKVITHSAQRKTNVGLETNRIL